MWALSLHCGSLAAWTRPTFRSDCCGLSGTAWGSAPSRVWAPSRTPPASRSATSSYGGCELDALPAGHRPLKVLHISDLHLTPYQGMKRRWLTSLADLEPDLVINTGDNLAHQESVGPLVEGFGRLLDVPGVFVFGSNDYFAPTVRNPLWYLTPDDGSRNVHTPKLPWRDLRDAFEKSGWTDVTNTSARLEVAGTSLAFVGVDDPHLGYDDLAAVAGPAPADVDLRVGVGARAVPPGARPVRPRRLRHHLRRTHARRPGLPAVQGRAS